MNQLTNPPQHGHQAVADSPRTPPAGRPVEVADLSIGGNAAATRESPWLVRGVKSYLRMIRTYWTAYLFAGLAVLLSAVAAASVGACIAALPIGLIAAIFASAANETPTRRAFATLMPRRGQMLMSQVVTAFILVTAVFAICTVIAMPLTAASAVGGAAVLGSYALSYVAVLLMSMLMFFTTVVTRSAPGTFGLVASGIIGVIAAGLAGTQELLALVPISATVLVGTGLAGLTLPAAVALLAWTAVAGVIAARRFQRIDFGGN